VRENVPLWTMGLEQPVTDRRAIELVALGLPLYNGLPLACDVTVASPLRADGTARPRAAAEPGTALAHREDDKLHRYPELAASARVRLVVLAGEVGGRWSATAAWLLRRLAAHKAAEAPPALRRGTALALERRWWGLLAVATQDALASTLLNDAPKLLHGRPPATPHLANLLLDHGGPPAPSRLPLR